MLYENLDPSREIVSWGKVGTTSVVKPVVSPRITMKTKGSLMVSHRRTSCEPDSWCWMAGRTQPTSADLDGIFAGTNAFSACPKADQVALRAFLDGQRDRLAVYEMNAAGVAFANGRPPIGNLYCVLKGCISLQWENEAGTSLGLFTCREGDLFGELGSLALLGLPSVDLGLQAAPIASRDCRMACLLEFPGRTVVELLKNRSFHCQLVDAAFRRLTNGVAWMPLRHDPTLVVAHFCVSSTCGEDLVFHSSLQYLASRVTVKKTVTFEELRRLSGFAVNSVRKELSALEELGYIHTTKDRRPEL